jgi:hypothetical protein
LSIVSGLSPHDAQATVAVINHWFALLLSRLRSLGAAVGATMLAKETMPAARAAACCGGDAII